MNIVHRDIKTANIFLHFPNKSKVTDKEIYRSNLIHDQVQVKLGDFGFAKRYKKTDLNLTQCGTPLNMAPEILNGQKYNEKIDIWSYGVTLFESLFGVTPFNGRDKADLRDNVNLGIVKFPQGLNLSSSCLDFISKCLLINPEKRMSIHHALNHPFMNKNSP